VVGVGAPAPMGEAGKGEDDVRGDVTVHSEELAHTLILTESIRDSCKQVDRRSEYPTHDTLLERPKLDKIKLFPSASCRRRKSGPLEQRFRLMQSSVQARTVQLLLHASITDTVDKHSCTIHSIEPTW
jgi:hypothetical protein